MQGVVLTAGGLRSGEHRIAVYEVGAPGVAAACGDLVGDGGQAPRSLGLAAYALEGERCVRGAEGDDERVGLGFGFGSGLDGSECRADCGGSGAGNLGVVGLDVFRQAESCADRTGVAGDGARLG